ncbi:MAG: DUF2760 domain-containing protein [Kofleriaceae bacterium]
MNRIALAFSCFFRLLFGGKLPAGAAAYLPAGAAPGLPAGGTGLPPATGDGAAKPAAAAPVAATPAPAKTERAPEKPRRDPQLAQRDGALALLALRSEAALIDFLREPLDGLRRRRHRRRRPRRPPRLPEEVLAHLSLEPIAASAEDAPTTVPRGFDPATIRLIGEAKGEPPFTARCATRAARDRGDAADPRRRRASTARSWRRPRSSCADGDLQRRSSASTSAPPTRGRHQRDRRRRRQGRAGRDHAHPAGGRTGAVDARPSLPVVPALARDGEVAPAELALPWTGPMAYAVGTFARDRGAELPHRLVPSLSWLPSATTVDRTAAVLPVAHGADRPTD